MVDYTKFSTEQLEEVLEDKKNKLYILTYIEKLNNELAEIEIIEELLTAKKAK